MSAGPRRHPLAVERVAASRRRSATSGGVARVRTLRGEGLAWRAFVVNAAILVAVSVVYAVTPATISSPIAVTELLVLALAIVVSLFVNLVLLRRTFGALDRLMGFMRGVDPLRPGGRFAIDVRDAEVAELGRSFNEMLDRIETERRESARRAIHAQEVERLRVARELHDGLGQSLTGILLLVDEVARARDDRGRETLEEVREAARAGLEEVRRIARDLRPEALDDLGLVRALDALGTTVAAHTGLAVRRSLPPRLPDLDLEQELVVYRVVQEALTNAARHAGARAVELAVSLDDGVLRARVRDDGRGFRPVATDGGGVTSMHERALLVQGRVDVASVLGEGTTVSLELPVGAAA